MNVGGISPLGSSLRSAVQQQVSTKVLSQVLDAQRPQSDAAVAGIKATADEAERTPDGDERGGRFQTTA